MLLIGFASKTKQKEGQSRESCKLGFETFHKLSRMAPIKVWELCGADKKRVFSPFCWATRLAVIHKGLEYETVPWWACSSLTFPWDFICSLVDITNL